MEVNNILFNYLKSKMASASEPLRLEHSDEAAGTGVKIVVKCRDITEEDPTTEKWLISITALELIDSKKAIGMQHKKLLQGLIEKKHKVVLKIADNDENLDKEWQIYQTLKNNKIPNLVKYLCFFRCADSIARYVKPSDYLCNGKGDTMQVLVMEYLATQSFKNFDWSTVSADVFRSCITQAILFSLFAFEKVGFVHGDYHLDNLIICRTQKKQLSYNEITIPVHGWQIKCLDLELSKIGVKEARLLFRDILSFSNKLLNLAYYIENPAPIHKMYNQTRIWIESGESNPRKVLELLPLVNKIQLRHDMRPGSGGAHLFKTGKRRPIMFGGKVP